MKLFAISIVHPNWCSVAYDVFVNSGCSLGFNGLIPLTDKPSIVFVTLSEIETVWYVNLLRILMCPFGVSFENRIPSLIVCVPHIILVLSILL